MYRGSCSSTRRTTLLCRSLPSMLAKVLERRDFAMVIVSGGAPCQGNCSLNKRKKGLADERTQAAQWIPKIAGSIAALDIAQMEGTAVLQFLENIAGALPEVVRWYTEIRGAEPIMACVPQHGFRGALRPQRHAPIILSRAT